MKRLLLLLIMCLSFSLFASESDIIRSYYELTTSFDTTKSTAEQTVVIDSFLKSSKSYLSSEENRDGKYYTTIEQMTKKVKLFQYMYQTFYNDGLFDKNNELLQELITYTLHGALNSSTDSLPELTAFEDDNYNKMLLEVTDINPAYQNMQLFVDRDLELSNYQVATDDERIELIRKMAKNTQFKNELAKSILDYVIKGKLRDCNSGDKQCELAKVMLTATDESGAPRFAQVSPTKLATQINAIIDRARDAIEREITDYETFNLTTSYVSGHTSGLKIPSYNGYTMRHATAPQDIPIIKNHTQILSEIYSLPGMNFLLNSTDFNEKIIKVTTPLLSNYCYQESGKEKVCGLIVAGGYGLRKSKYFKTKYISEAIDDLYNAIDVSKKQVSKTLKTVEKIENIKSIAYSRSDYNPGRNNKTILLKSLLLKVIEQSPTSLGAALISTPELIAGLKNDLGVFAKALDRRQLVDNAKNVVLISGLITCAFFTSPVAITAGVVISLYELYAYGSKYFKYKKLKNLVLSDLVSMQRNTDQVTNYNLQQLSVRVALLQEKVEKYKLYSLFAAAGLMSAPISVGSILSKSAKSLDDFVENLRYMEWFLKRLAHSELTRKKFFHAMKVFNMTNPKSMIYQLIQCRPYLREIIEFSETALIHKVHHKIKHPEKAHLLERAISGSGYGKEAISQSKEAEAIIELMNAALDSNEGKLFNE